MMFKKVILSAMFVFPFVADAAMPYRVQQVGLPSVEVSGVDTSALARERRFYVGGMYNFSMWDAYTNDQGINFAGDNTSSFEALAGLRIYDTFRMELNYLRADMSFDAFSFTGDTFFVNAIVDARIDSLYRLFRTQMLVPYVGIGAGLSWNSADNGVHLDKKIAPVAAVLAGVGVEFNSVFALDFGYRYFYMFEPGVDVASGLNPSSHQFRAGARISF